MNTISASDAAELYEAGGTAGPWTIVGATDSHYSRQSRWHNRYWLVVRDGNGNDWGIEYGIGLTENQEHDLPWDDVPDDRQLPLVRLYPQEVTTVEYRTRPAEPAEASA